MKRLVSLKDIEQLISEGKAELAIDNNVIITPSAKDLVKSEKIKIIKSSVNLKEESIENKNAPVEEEFSNEKVLKLFKTIIERGLLEEMIKTLSETNKLPYQCEKDSSGLKVVKGNSVKMDYFDTGDSTVKAYFQEIISKEESKISAGFLTIEESSFPWELTYEEIDYVIEGTLTIEIDGKSYRATEGDIVFVPSGSKVIWSAEKKVKLFYATYPANWADLL